MDIRKALIAFLVIMVCSFVSTSVYAQKDSSYKIGFVDLEDPPNIKTTYTYDPTTGNYLEVITIGDKPIGSPRVLTFMEYMKAKEKQDRENLLPQKRAMQTTM